MCARNFFHTFAQNRAYPWTTGTLLFTRGLYQPWTTRNSWRGIMWQAFL